VARKDTPGVKGLTRRQSVCGAAAIAVGGKLGFAKIYAQPRQAATTSTADLAFINGRLFERDVTTKTQRHKGLAALVLSVQSR
jgi:hypothetical protein